MTTANSGRLDGVARALTGDLDPVDADTGGGFLICDGTTPAFRIRYADLRARRVLAGSGLVGAPLDTVFDLGEGGRLLRRLQRAVSNGEGETFFTHTRAGGCAARDVHAHIRPLAADGRSTWALCSFGTRRSTGAVEPQVPALRAEPMALELGDLVDRIAHRLRMFLPGRVDIRVERPPQAVWVAAAAHDVEDVVSACLATAMPLDPSCYVAKLAVEDPIGAGGVRLAVGLVGECDGELSDAPLPGALAEQAAGLGFELVRGRARDGCPELALVLPRVAALRCDAEGTPG